MTTFATGCGWGWLLLIALGDATGYGDDSCRRHPQLPQGASRATSTPSTPGGSKRDIMELQPFALLEPRTDFIDPEGTLPPPSAWSTRFPSGDGRSGSERPSSPTMDTSGVSITTVTNLVRHGCRDHSWADPPVGPSVNNLAAALGDLGPFRVTSPPKDMTIYGYSGKHLELTVPDLPVEGQGDNRRFARCSTAPSRVGSRSSTQPKGGRVLRLNGGPGHTEDFWILDIEGTRLMIEANWSPNSPRKDLAEMRTILDSIRIDP